MGPGIARLMEEADAEYAECYCAGVPAAEMAAAGFAERDEACPNIIPNYLTPPLYENTEYCYFTSDPDGFMPVSYTPLDVYKRQVFIMSSSVS